MIANSGWKAVAINPSTPISFPDSMTVSNLTIRGAWDTENTLLLNYFGTALPLTVLNGLALQDDGRIENFNSGLVVQSGAVVITNSAMIQDGGFVRTTNAQMNLSDAEYDLTNGFFEGGVVWIGAPVSSQFNQYGGTATIATLDLGPRNPGSGSRGGTYSLYGGNLNLPGGLSLFGDNGSMASYFQSGGTNQTTQVIIEPGLFGISPSFKLNGGLLTDTNVEIIADYFGSAMIEQNGGTHFVSNILDIAGAASSSTTVLPGIYSLNGGNLSALSINLDASEGDAAFIQTNGTTQAGEIHAHSSGSQTYYVATLTLAGGTLSCSNLTSIDGGNIHQYGGALTVSNSLDVDGYREPGPKLYTRYEFFGGTLIASNINIGGDWIIGDSSGTNRISNAGYCSLSHTLQISNAVEQLGRFILASNATINLAGTASRLAFQDSHNENWSTGTILIVTNWNGDQAGGGAEQLKFGTDQSGLTATQLNQIRFRFAADEYTAKILSTGEVVPDQLIPAVLTFMRQGNIMILNWPAGWTLQASTNVPGPYADMPQVTSPYTTDTTTNPQQYFRLRR